MATAWQTAIPSLGLSAHKKRRIYFIQDDERAFEATGDASNLIELGMNEFGAAITAGSWLETICSSYGVETTSSFNFGADKVYRHRERAQNKKIVAYYQPGKPRRQAALLLATLGAICDADPSITVDLVGGGNRGFITAQIYNHGALAPIDLSMIYHTARVGLVLSATNASLIPYEMRACGIPVVTNVGANAEWLGKELGIFYEVAKDYPQIETQRILVDAVTTNMVLKTGSLDTLVASNLHADILSDLAAALSGSLGIAPTANLNPERRFPSMFEPIHGSAFDITGKGIANPIATFWTACLMLEHLGEVQAAQRLMSAIEKVTAKKLHTPDLGGEATTAIVTEAVCDLI
jgi:uncharacterized protein (DUF697 family)